MKKLSTTAAIAAALLLSSCSVASVEAPTGGGKPLVVAFPVPLTSGNKATAEQMVNVAELAVKSINDSGGAGGRQLVLKTYDDKLTADESAKVAQRALTVDNAEVVVGGYTTIEGLAIREVTDRRKILYLATSTISPQLTKDAKYTFRIAHNQGDFPVMMADLAGSLGLKKTVVVHDDGATGATLFGPVVDALKAKGIGAADPVGFALNAPDLSSAVANIGGQGADSVILVNSSAADAGLLVKTLAEQGIHVPVIGFSAAAGPDALKIGGAAYETLDLYSLQNKQQSKPSFIELAKNYAAAYGGDAKVLENSLPEQAGQTWDGFTILKKALDSTKGNTDGDQLAAAIRGLEPFEGIAGKTGSKLSLVDRPDAYSKSLVALKLKNGVFSELAP